MPSTEINEMTQREWRELGFFYDRDDEANEWRLKGSKAGLRYFAHTLQTYAAQPRHEQVSEHHHLGPYGYFEIGTWTTPEITDHWIAGPLVDIQKLALSVIARLDTASFGDCIDLRREFAPLSPYDLVLEVLEDTFDPAQADSACW